MKKQIIWGLVSVLILVLVLGILRVRGRLIEFREANALNPRFIAEVEQRDLELSIVGKGSIQPNVKKQVRPVIDGEINSLTFEEGDFVKAGQILMMLSNTSLEFRLRQAELDLELARRSLESLECETGAYAKAQLELRQSQLNLSNVEDKINLLEITSHVTGEVRDFTVGPGDSVKVGQVMCWVVDTGQLTVVARIPQAELHRISLDQAVTVFAGGEFAPVHGVVGSVGETGTQVGQKVEFPVEIVITRPDTGLKPGMNVMVTFYDEAGAFCSMPGTVSPYDREEVRAGIDGGVAEIKVSEGNLVIEGQVLMGLTDDSLMLSLEQAQNALDDALRNLDSVAYSIEQQRLKVEQAQLSVTDIRDQVSGLTITSPISGKILSMPVSQGDSVSAATVVAEVASTNPLTITIDVDELDISHIEQGQACEITLDAFPGRKWEGIVDRISLEGQPRDGITNYRVSLVFDSDEVRLGMSAAVRIFVARKQGVTAVPVEAITWESGKTYVYRVEDGQVIRTEVILGIQGDQYAEVLSGLEDGDTVYTGDPANIGSDRFFGWSTSTRLRW